jgi:hypothetical protein
MRQHKKSPTAGIPGARQTKPGKVIVYLDYSTPRKKLQRKVRKPSDIRYGGAL